MFGKGLNGVRPKYLTEPGFKLASHGYIGLGEVDHDGPIVLAEGLPDYASLPVGRRLMSPGTGGIGNDIIRATSYKHDTIAVPDYDSSGIRAVLRLLNNGIHEDPRSNLRICFVKWVTGDPSDDINDLRRYYQLSRRAIYEELVNRAIPITQVLDRLRPDYDIERVKGKYN